MLFDGKHDFKDLLQDDCKICISGAELSPELATLISNCMRFPLV